MSFNIIRVLLENAYSRPLLGVFGGVWRPYAGAAVSVVHAKKGRGYGHVTALKFFKLVPGRRPDVYIPGQTTHAYILRYWYLVPLIKTLGWRSSCAILTSFSVVFSERGLTFTFAICYRPSVRLLSVTFVRRKQVKLHKLYHLSSTPTRNVPFEPILRCVPISK